MPKYKFKRSSNRIEQRECQNMLEKMPNSQLQAIVSVLYISGARISEVLQLDTDSVLYDPKKKEVEIDFVSLKRKGKEKRLPYKITRPLIFSTNTPFLSTFLSYWKLRKEQVKNKPLRLFNITRQLVWYYIKKVNEFVSPHIFRHSRLQKLADRGIQAHQIRMFAGHSQLNSAIAYISSSKASMLPLKDVIE